MLRAAPRSLVASPRSSLGSSSGEAGSLAQPDAPKETARARKARQVVRCLIDTPSSRFRRQTATLPKERFVFARILASKRCRLDEHRAQPDVQSGLFGRTPSSPRL